MLKFYHAPWSRSSNILWLMEELGVPYEIEHVDIRQEGGVPESYRSVQPNKKVPAIEHDGAVVTERAAIAIYLCDAFPQAGLAPKIGDPARGPYLTWLVYADSVFDPVVAVNLLGLKYPGSGVSFGTLEDMLANLERRLAAERFITGDRFTAADVAMAGNMGYVMQQGWLPKRPGFEDYVTRATDRLAFKRAQEKDQALAMKVPALAAMLQKR
jgi:glutathione S-transferase